MPAKFRVSRFALMFLVLAVLGLSTACTKKEEAREGAAGPSAAQNEDPLNLAATLLRAVPADTIGFLTWNLQHPAFLKFKNSPWYSANNPVTPASPLVGTTGLSILQAAGIDPENKEQIEALLQEGAVFALPVPAAAGTPDSPASFKGGVIFRSAPGVNLEEKGTAIKKTLEGRQIALEPLTLKVGKGFGFDAAKLVPAPAGGVAAEEKPFKVFVGWSANLAVETTDAQLTDQVLSAAAGTDGGIPAFAKSPEFQTAAKTLPSNEARFLTGGIDAAKVIELASKNKTADDVDLSKQPFGTAALGVGMSETPESVLNISVAPKTPEQRTLFSSLGSVLSTAFTAAVPEQPMVFVNAEVQTVKQIRDTMEKTTPAGDPVWDFAAKLKRVGFVTRTAPVGQSLLPIPDVAVILESDQAPQVMAQIQDLATQGMGSAGMPAPKWADKTIEGVNVKVLNPGVGLALHLAAANNLVFASTSESQLRTALIGAKSGTSAFFGKLSPRAKEVIGSNSRTVGSLYIDFTQIATFMESIQGMLSMYAPTGEGAGAPGLPDAEGMKRIIESFRKSGTVVASASSADNMLSFRSYYEKPAVAQP